MIRVGSSSQIERNVISNATENKKADDRIKVERATADRRYQENKSNERASTNADYMQSRRAYEPMKKRNEQVYAVKNLATENKKSYNDGIRGSKIDTYA